METYIIRNKTSMVAYNAVRLVESIVADGKVAERDGIEQFTRFTRTFKHTVISKKNKGDSFTFTITDNK